MRDVAPDLVAFTHLLRGAGLRLGTGQVVAFVEASATLAPTDLDDLYWAGRATLATHQADVPAYDRVFRAFFRGATPHVTVEGLDADADDADVDVAPAERRERSDDGDDEAMIGAVASEAERLHHRRFDMATAAELAAMRRLMARIPVDVPRRRTRRSEAVHRGRRPDLRRTVRRAIQTDGELIRRAWRARRRRPRPLVLLLDVSGSMAGYSRALLQFAFSARVTRGTLEVFCFGTRLTRVTEDLDRRNVDAALSAAAERVLDWDGGTMIGRSIATLNRVWGRRGTLRGAIVVICSDGLERGDPEELDAAMARLARYAHRVVWVNPLKGDPRYAPIQRGMRAALPHVDRLVSGHDLASLHHLADVLGALR